MSINRQSFIIFPPYSACMFPTVCYTLGKNALRKNSYEIFSKLCETNPNFAIFRLKMKIVLKNEPKQSQFWPKKPFIAKGASNRRANPKQSKFLNVWTPFILNDASFVFVSVVNLGKPMYYCKNELLRIFHRRLNSNVQLNQTSCSNHHLSY